MKDLSFQGEWFGVRSIFANSIGLTTNYEKRISAIKSKSFVSRLSLSKTLDFHQGCVNALNFNTTGDLIASGSDDLKICISNWNKDETKPLFSYDSGHHGNVFQSKFMPFSNNTIIVSCARDGQVRVGYLSSEGLQETKKIVQHKGSAHKLSVSNSSPHMLRSAGEDGIVYNIDLRDSPEKLITIRNSAGNKVPLYSIHNNPFNEYEFAVCGRDPWARIFDERMIKKEEKKYTWVQQFCPEHLKKADEKEFNPSNLTCIMYNYSGTELLCSYNDEEIYIFDTTDTTESNFTHVFKGHRNSETVKGVNFLGPRSEYVVSGSDCGHVFIWEKKTQEIVTFLKGDEGVVNVLEPHPTSCILATSGLEHNIKVWEPIGDIFDEHDKLTKQIKANELAREEDKTQGGSGRDLFYLMMIMNHMRRRRRQRQRAARRGEEGEGTGDGDGEGDDDSSEDDDNDDDSDSDLSTDDNNDDDADDDDDDDNVTQSCVQS